MSTSSSPSSLKTGFTTGAAAAAGAKAALYRLVSGKSPEAVSITFLTGEERKIPVHSCVLENDQTACCIIIKDAGDDPDITHKAEIGARVTLEDIPCAGLPPIRITGGIGVGTVTRPGLETPPGQPAITSGPITLITNSIHDVLVRYPVHSGIHVEVFVPEGQSLAKKTLNARLGIIGGISILGTTGIVRPMSHEAYVATIRKSLDVAKAAGLSHGVLTTGRRSERFAQALLPDLPELAFIQIGDFFQESMTAAAARGFLSATLAVFFGKAVKMAQAIAHTHAARSDLSLQELSGWTLEMTGSPELAHRIRTANTARHAFDPLREKAPQVIFRVAEAARNAAEGFSGNMLSVRCIIFDYDGRPVVDTDFPGG